MPTTELPDGKRICESCFEVRLPVLIEQYPEIAEAALEEARGHSAPSASSSPSLPSQNSDADTCSLCGFCYGPERGSHGAHWRTAHPNEAAY